MSGPPRVVIGEHDVLLREGIAALAVEQRLRARLLDRLLDGAGSSLGSAAQATAVIDEVERVGAYAERYQPARVASTLVPLVLLAAVFPLNWLVGVLFAHAPTRR